MYSIVLLAAMTATDTAPSHGWTKTHGYGVGYGGCYGVGYTGWPYNFGGWGQPYGGYWAGYACGGACGGYNSVAFGGHAPTLTQAPTTYAPAENKDDRKRDKDDKEDGDKMKKDPDNGPAKKKTKDDDEDKAQARARLSFELPKGAALYVDGQLIERAEERKAFRTPPLAKGEKYYYELRVEVVRDGKKVVESKRVTLAAGDEIRTDFSKVGTTTGVAAAEAPR